MDGLRRAHRGGSADLEERAGAEALCAMDAGTGSRSVPRPLITAAVTRARALACIHEIISGAPIYRAHAVFSAALLGRAAAQHGPPARADGLALAAHAR